MNVLTVIRQIVLTCAWAAFALQYAPTAGAQDVDAPAPEAEEPVEAPSKETADAEADSPPADPPRGVQHLVAPGEDWGAVLSKAGPGDQILLMPGEHRSVTIDGGGGTPEAPVVVRPMDPSSPILITGKRYGLRLRNVHDVVLQDLVIRSATLRGITITNGEPSAGLPIDSDAVTPMTDWAPTVHANVVLRNVRVERVGPTGQRPAIMIQQVEGVEIDQCTLQGWGGAAIEIIGARDINVHDTVFEPLDDHSQLHGVWMRAGSSDVHVHQCRFNGITESVFQLGGGSEAFEFIAPPERPDDDQSAAALFDAHNVIIERNVLTECGPAFGIVSASNVELRHNTIVRPQGYVVRLDLPSQEQVPLHTPANLTLAFNLITWQAGDLKAYTLTGEGFPVESITLGRNLWWSGDETEEERAAYKPFPGPVLNPQLTKEDPILNDELRPSNRAAHEFGHLAR